MGEVRGWHGHPDTASQTLALRISVSQELTAAREVPHLTGSVSCWSCKLQLLCLLSSPSASSLPRSPAAKPSHLAEAKPKSQLLHHGCVVKAGVGNSEQRMEKGCLQETESMGQKYHGFVQLAAVEITEGVKCLR